VEVLMTRYAGDELFANAMKVQQQMKQQQQRRDAIMERQRQRDVAAASGKIVPFSEADIM
jgi:hypothetical protein